MTRFTGLQLVLIQGMEDLISLYNDHVPTGSSGKDKKVNWEGLRENTEKFLESFFGQPYFKKLLEKTREKDVIKIIRRKLFPINQTALKDFLDLIGELKRTVNKKPYSHFIIRCFYETKSVEYKLQKKIEEKFEHTPDWDLDSVISPSAREAIHYECQKELEFESHYNYLRNGSRNRTDRFDSKQKPDIQFIESRMNEVRPTSDFGYYLITKISPHDEKSNIMIPHVNYRDWKSFTQIVKSLLVTYNEEFKNFKRIKTCDYCGKLFFERKEGKKKFCSDNCRKMYFHNKQDINVLKCRMRQNVWIRRYYNDLSEDSNTRLQGYTLQKDQCSDCNVEGDKTLKGGKCPKVTELNPKLIKLYEEHKKKKEEERKELKVKRKR